MSGGARLISGDYMKSKFLAAAALVAAGMSAPAFAATQIFLEIPGVAGEAQTMGYEGQIELLSTNYGLSSDAKKACTAQDLSATKFVDRATADLIMAAAIGTTYPTAKITFARTTGGGALQKALQIDMTGVRISSYNSGGINGEDRTTENLSLSFATFAGKVFVQNNDDTVTERPFTANCM